MARPRAQKHTSFPGLPNLDGAGTCHPLGTRRAKGSRRPVGLIFFLQGGVGAQPTRDKAEGWGEGRVCLRLVWTRLVDLEGGTHHR